MIAIQDVDGRSMAFSGDMKKLLPAWDDIPTDFKDWNNKWSRIIAQWFFRGLDGATFMPKKGVDQKKALAHIQAILQSWEPKHEHKTAGCAYLLSEWFDDVKLPKESKK